MESEFVVSYELNFLPRSPSDNDQLSTINFQLAIDRLPAEVLGRQVDQ